jgi:hypothetical protein
MENLGMKPKEWNIPGPSGQCAATGQPIPPGANYHTVLYQEAGQWVRRDYALQAFTGPPPEAFAHWQGRMPRPESSVRPPQLDPHACLAFLDQTVNAMDERTLALRYVAALFLWRRRRLRLRDADRDSHGRECLHFHDPKNSRTYTVIDPQLTSQQFETFQTELSRLAEGNEASR